MIDSISVQRLNAVEPKAITVSEHLGVYMQDEDTNTVVKTIGEK